MSKEHSGGPYPPGYFRVPVEWSEETASAIAIEQFPHVDEAEDLVRERLAQGQPLAPLILSLARRWLERDREEILVKLLSLILSSKKPGLRAAQVAFAVGLYVTAEKSGTELAREFGISKEAWQQGVERVREELGLRQTRTMRDPAARATMRSSNYRRRRMTG